MLYTLTKKVRVIGITKMSFSISDNTIAKLFAEGKSGRKHPVESTGDKLFYHGNLIAEWKKNGLHISNGGYVPPNGSTGSLSTKFLLNALPNVSLSVHRKQWYLSGEKCAQIWDGGWICLGKEGMPKHIEKGESKLITLATEYVKAGGWRGYEQPINYVAGANDTGSWEDSPCPSIVAEAELQKVREVLRKEKIKFKETTCRSSNGFCVHRYIVTSARDRQRAAELLKPLTEETRLLYIA